VYVGSYGTLTSFLRQCRDFGCEALADDEYEVLLKAVEDLSRQGTGQRMDKNQAHFEDCDDGAFEEILPALGIDCLVVKTKKEKVVEEDMCPTRTMKDADKEKVLQDLSFDNRSLTNVLSDVSVLVYAFQTPHDLTFRYGLDRQVLGNWITAIAEAYRPNPYHSWRHAFDVFQFTYTAMTLGHAARFFNNQDLLALFLAQIGHDVAHTGTNNAHLVRTGHDLALTYNDQSVLENMHASVVFKTLKKPGHNCLEPLSEREFSNVREKVVSAILATDMSKHFEFVDRFSARISQTENNPFQTDTKEDRERQKASKADRRMLLQAFIHMADLGHCCRPWAIHRYLVVGLEDEFFLQGDLERSMGIPCMPMMDRTKDKTAATQDFFLGKLVLPLLQPYTHFVSDEVKDFLIGNLTTNRDKWRGLVEKHGKQTALDMIALGDKDAKEAELDLTNNNDNNNTSNSDEKQQQQQQQQEEGTKEQHETEKQIDQSNGNDQKD